MAQDQADARTVDASDAEALAELERFVVDNDDLLALEERIGRFNIFDALGVARTEIRHSNFLAWLLDPAESHGQGALFLSRVLMDLLKTARDGGYDCPLSPIQLDGADLKGVEVRREWRNIDLLILCDDPKFVVAIENKIDSGEHSNQLDRYEDTVRQAFPDTPLVLAYLSVDDEEPSSDRWVPYTYADIHRVLRRLRQTHATSIGEDVLTFLDHYLNLIGSRFMDDPKIDELCRRIYKNHRQAIDLIRERMSSQIDLVLAEMKSLVEKSSDWIAVGGEKGSIGFIPATWRSQNLLPSIGNDRRYDDDAWLLCGFWCGQEHATIWVYAYPTRDPELRRRVVVRLIQDPAEFGLKAYAGRVYDEWSKLLSTEIIDWRNQERIDWPTLNQKASAALYALHKQLEGVPDALQPIIEQWERDGRP